MLLLRMVIRLDCLRSVWRVSLLRRHRMILTDRPPNKQWATVFVFVVAVVVVVAVGVTTTTMMMLVRAYKSFLLSSQTRSHNPQEQHRRRLLSVLLVRQSVSLCVRVSNAVKMVCVRGLWITPMYQITCLPSYFFICVAPPFLLFIKLKPNTVFVQC